MKVEVEVTPKLGGIPYYTGLHIIVKIPDREEVFADSWTIQCTDPDRQHLVYQEVCVLISRTFGKIALEIDHWWKYGKKKPE